MKKTLTKLQASILDTLNTMVVRGVGGETEFYATEVADHAGVTTSSARGVLERLNDAGHVRRLGRYDSVRGGGICYTIDGPGGSDTPGSLCFECQEKAEIVMAHDGGEHDGDEHDDCPSCQGNRRFDAECEARSIPTADVPNPSRSTARCDARNPADGSRCWSRETPAHAEHMSDGGRWVTPDGGDR